MNKLLATNSCFVTVRSEIKNMKMIKVLVVNQYVLPIAKKILGQHCEVIATNDKATKEEIFSLLPGVHAFLWSRNLKIDKEFLDVAGPQLKVIAMTSTGYDHVDLEEVKKRGIRVAYNPNVQNGAVAEFAIFLALGAARRAIEAAQSIKDQTWYNAIDFMLGYGFAKSTVGIVGFGGIGQAIAKRLQNFDVDKILYCGPSRKIEDANLGAEYVDFDALLKQSDFVIASCRLNAQTEKMFNAEAFRKMKKTAIFVNIARGNLVEQDDLIEALENGTIFAAGLDVMTPEPLPADHKLLTLSNCFLMPHISSGTYETRNEMITRAAKNIFAGLNGRPMTVELI